MGIELLPAALCQAPLTLGKSADFSKTLLLICNMRIVASTLWDMKSRQTIHNLLDEVLSTPKAFSKCCNENISSIIESHLRKQKNEWGDIIYSGLDIWLPGNEGLIFLNNPFHSDSINIWLLITCPYPPTLTHSSNYAAWKAKQALQHTHTRVCTCMHNTYLCTHSLASSTNCWHLLLRNRTWHTFHNRIFLQLLPVLLSSLSPSTPWGGCPSRCQLLFYLKPIHTLYAARWKDTVPIFCSFPNSIVFKPHCVFAMSLKCCSWAHSSVSSSLFSYSVDSWHTVTAFDCLLKRIKRQLDLHLKLAWLTVLYSRSGDLAIIKASQPLSSE